MQTAHQSYASYREWCESIGVQPADLPTWGAVSLSLGVDELQKYETDKFLASLHPDGSNLASFHGVEPDDEDEEEYGREPVRTLESRLRGRTSNYTRQPLPSEGWNKYEARVRNHPDVHTRRFMLATHAAVLCFECGCVQRVADYFEQIREFKLQCGHRRPEQRLRTMQPGVEEIPQ